MEHDYYRNYRVHLINFSAPQVDALASEGWTTAEIAKFSGLSPYVVRTLCTIHPDRWLSEIHKRKHRRREFNAVS